MISRTHTSTVLALAGLTFSGCAHTNPDTSRSAESRQIYSRALEEQKTNDIILKTSEFARQLHARLPQLQTKHHAVVERGKGLVSLSLPFGERVQIDERPAARVADADYRAWSQRAAQAGLARIEEYRAKGFAIEAVMVTPHGYMFPLIDGAYNIGSIERLFPNAPSLADVEAERLEAFQEDERRETLRNAPRSS